MKLVNYVAVGLLGVFAGVSGTIAYMEYITTPAKYCPIDLNREGMTEKIFIQDRREG